MSDIDLLVREHFDIPDDKDTVDYCKDHGLDYSEECKKAYARSMENKNES